MEILDNVLIDIHLIQWNRIPILNIEIDIDQRINRNRNIAGPIHVLHRVNLTDDIDVKPTRNQPKAIHVVIDDIHQPVPAIVHHLVTKIVIENDELR